MKARGAEPLRQIFSVLLNFLSSFIFFYFCSPAVNQMIPLGTSSGTSQLLAGVGAGQWKDRGKSGAFDLQSHGKQAYG